MLSRREFLQFAAVAGAYASSGTASGATSAASTGATSSVTTVAARQKLTQDQLLDFDARGNLTLLHVTDIHAQLKPVYFRPPSQNIGVGAYADVPPHLVAEEFLSYFGIAGGTPSAYAHTMLDYVNLARAYGKLGGLDRTATLIKAVRAERGDDNVVLLDGGDTWQGSYTALQTGAQDMLECMNALSPDAMVGHWEFTLGEERVLELIEQLTYPFLASNIVDTDWEEPVFDSTRFLDRGGARIAIIGQAMPYTPVSNPHWMFPQWSFGIRTATLQKNVNSARAAGADVVVLLSHNGFDVDRKLARELDGIDVILTGHTHDAIPKALQIGSTLMLSSGSHGKYLGRIDLEVKNGKVVNHNSTLIPVFADVIEPDADMSGLIESLRAPYINELSRPLAKTESLLFRRGNFNGSWDDLLCNAMIEQRDAQISLSPGFRWGPTLLPGDTITVEDLYNQTAMSYPNVYRQEMSGEHLKRVLEDVCDNLFNKDPFLQQGGDMVRTGGLGYTCRPNNELGSRISDLTLLETGEAIAADKNYVVAGWASIRENVEGPPIFDLVEEYLEDRDTISIPANTAVKTEL